MIPIKRGTCPKCNQPNTYGKITCDFCGDRLPWADSFAVHCGEKCPVCQMFNAYENSFCRSCAQPLPWYDGAAATRKRSGRGESDQQMLLTIILVGSFIFFVLFFLLADAVRPH